MRYRYATRKIRTAMVAQAIAETGYSAQNALLTNTLGNRRHWPLASTCSTGLTKLMLSLNAKQTM